MTMTTQRKKKTTAKARSSPPASGTTVHQLLLRDGAWTVSKSGVSVDAGATRIRMERTGPDADLKLRAQVIASAPSGYNLADLVRQVSEDLQPRKPGVAYGGVELSDEQWRNLIQYANAVFAQVGEPEPKPEAK
jgi:hypothetical protein